jgi:tRNA threonylcarbamoyladenosine biosynthesis protein TsaE
LASVVTPDAHVCSPTYTIVNEYRSHGRTLCHLDLYRIEDEDDLYSIGFYDYQGVMMAAEWCEKVPYALPPHHLRICIEKTGEESRTITIEEIAS